MAIAFGNVASTSGKIDSPWPAMTLVAPSLAGSDRVLVLAATLNTSASLAIESATYNGVSLGTPSANIFVNYVQTIVWVVVNPASGATFSLTITAQGSPVPYTLQAGYYSGVHQTTPNRTPTTATGTSNPATAGVTNSQAGDLIVGIFGLDDTTAANGMTEARVGAGQTYRNTVTNSTSEAAGALCDEAGASGTVTHSWDFVNNADNGWGLVAIPLIPASTAETKSVADSASGADTIAQLRASLGISDSGAGADTFAPAPRASVPVAETGGGADALVQLLAALQVAEAGTGAEATPAIGAAVPVAESGAGADAAPAISVALILTDGGSGEDAINILTEILKTLADTATGSDTISGISASLGLTDSGSGADATPAILVSVSLTDGASAIDALAQVLAAVQVAETSAGADVIGSLTISLAVADTGSAGEAPAISVQLALADSGVGADAISLLTELLKSLTDAGSGADAIAAIAASLTVSEAGTGAELPAIAVSLSLADAASGLEALQVLQQALKTILDAAAGTDAVGSITVHVPVPDAAAAVDGVASLSASLIVSDVGTSSEAPAIRVNLAVTDSAAAADLIAQVIRQSFKAVADAGVGADAVGALTVHVLLADVGQASDVLGAIAAAVSVADLAAGVDMTVAFDASVKLVRATFTLRHGQVRFALAKRRMRFTLN